MLLFFISLGFFTFKGFLPSFLWFSHTFFLAHLYLRKVHGSMKFKLFFFSFESCVPQIGCIDTVKQIEYGTCA